VSHFYYHIRIYLIWILLILSQPSRTKSDTFRAEQQQVGEIDEVVGPWYCDIKLPSGMMNTCFRSTSMILLWYVSGYRRWLGDRANICPTFNIRDVTEIASGVIIYKLNGTDTRLIAQLLVIAARDTQFFNWNGQLTLTLMCAALSHDNSRSRCVLKVLRFCVFLQRKCAIIREGHRLSPQHRSNIVNARLIEIHDIFVNAGDEHVVLDFNAC